MRSTRARENNSDVLLIDTAGRLQNKQALMDELEKVIRVLRKIDPTAPHQVLLVLDATTGQNALNQVEVFKDKAGVTGLVMTKLDGTAAAEFWSQFRPSSAFRSMPSGSARVSRTWPPSTPESLRARSP